MIATETQFKVAILDDYQKVALQMTDWSGVQRRASVEVFSDTLTVPDDLAARELVLGAGSRRWGTTLWTEEDADQGQYVIRRIVI